MWRSLFSCTTSPSRKKTRLRHVLHLGSLMERHPEAFYRRFAEKVPNADVIELCLRLADDELRHFRLIGNILSGWGSLPVTQADLEAMDANGKLRSMFLSPPSPSATKEEIIEYAVNEEKKMVAFYGSFEKEFIPIWKKMEIWDMMEEEKSHVKKLSDMLFCLKQSVAKAR